MTFSFVKQKLGFVFRFLLRFLLRSSRRAMGCLLSCLRFQDDSSRPESRENRLPLFLPKEKEDTSLNDRDDFGLGSQSDEEGLNDEAKFLKAGVSLGGNPPEVRKASDEKLKVSPSSEDSNPSSFHSHLPDTSVEKLQLEFQPSTPSTPKSCGEWGNGKDSLEHAQNSSVAQDAHCISLCSKDENTAASASPWPSTSDIHRRNKSVRFECENDVTFNVHKQSPYPTPLKLSVDMQTPGTVYPTWRDLPNAKPRVGSQNLYSYYNLGGNCSKYEIPKEENHDPPEDSDDLCISFEQSQNATPTPKDGLKEISYEHQPNVEESLSYWLKPASVTHDKRNGRMESTVIQIPHSCKTPAEKPIIGMISANCNENEDPQILSPKFWGDNGIPNSTKKYKEDQKVSWHATPFEERLEKALSVKSFISQSQRNNVFGKPSTSEIEEK